LRFVVVPLPFIPAAIGPCLRTMTMSEMAIPLPGVGGAIGSLHANGKRFRAYQLTRTAGGAHGDSFVPKHYTTQRERTRCGGCGGGGQ
jgi:hypothetical protein